MAQRQNRCNDDEGKPERGASLLEPDNCHFSTRSGERKTPGGFPPRACVHTSMINRSGIEVAMHAEPELPVVLVVDGS